MVRPTVSDVLIRMDYWVFSGYSVSRVVHCSVREDTSFALLGVGGNLALYTALSGGRMRVTVPGHVSEIKAEGGPAVLASAVWNCLSPHVSDWQGEESMNTCCVTGCDQPGAFRTRTRPTWCSEHLAGIYRQGGLELLEPFTKPSAFLLTRCLRCGFEGHYRFEYVLDRLSVGEKVCRACYWRAWAKTQRALLPSHKKESVFKIKKLAEENGFIYLGPLTDPVLPEDPHATQCKRCGRIEARRTGDMGWGCPCSRKK